MVNETKEILDTPIDRRTFLKAVGTGTAAVLFGGQLAMEEAFAAMPSTIGILQLGSCNGCQISLLEFGMDLRTIGTSDPTAAAYLPRISIKYAPLLADVLESTFQNNISSLDLCIVEGIAGDTVESTALLQRARAISKKVVAVGNCASYGGVPGLNAKKGLLNLYPVNKAIAIDGYLPGCPPLPEHLWYLISGGTIGEPVKAGRICNDCIWHDSDDARGLGQPGCKEELGCRGPSTSNRCSCSRSTGGHSPCTWAGDLCTGCYSSSFPFGSGGSGGNPSPSATPQPSASATPRPSATPQPTRIPGGDD